MKPFSILFFWFALSTVFTEIAAESNLPIVYIKTPQEIGSAPKVPCTVKLIPSNGSELGNTNLIIGQIRFHGASSQGYDKKSLALTLDTSTRWLDLQPRRQWVLNAAFVDCSMMRHKLSYDLFQSLSAPGAKRFASSSRFVEVDLNGHYHGAYLLMERVDRSMLGLRRFDKTATNQAVIYKAIDHGANFLELGHSAYEQREPADEELQFWGPLDDLNHFVSQSSDALFFDANLGINSRVDLDNAIDFHLLILFTSNMDGIDKNFLLARDALTATPIKPKFFFVPWDYDATFGRNWEGSRVAPTAWLSNHLFDRLLSNLTYQQRYASRWKVLRKNQFSAENLARRIDDNAQTLGAAAQRNELRWKGITEPGSGQLTFTEDLKQMKRWVTARLQWLDTEIAQRTQR
jgi:CotH kinase protein